LENAEKSSEFAGDRRKLSITDFAYTKTLRAMNPQIK